MRDSLEKKGTVGGGGEMSSQPPVRLEKKGTVEGGEKGDSWGGGGR